MSDKNSIFRIYSGSIAEANIIYRAYIFANSEIKLDMNQGLEPTQEIAINAGDDLIFYVSDCTSFGLISFVTQFR